MTEKKLLGMLGLAGRAGRVVSGQSRVLAGIRDGSVRLAVLDGGAAGNTKDAVRRACRYHQVPLTELKEEDQLGASIGRPAVRVVGVVDELFAQQLRGGDGTGTEV